MTRKLLINGRFLGGARTAVNSVAYALTDQLCAEPGRWQVEVAIPSELKDTPVPASWPLRVTGTRSGIVWEQCDLPKLRAEGVIAGFFNTVPMRARGHVTMLHDAQVFSAKQSYKTTTRLWRAALSRRAGARGNYVLTVSEHSKQDLLRHRVGTAERIGVVPNGAGHVTQACPDNGVLQSLKLQADDKYCVALATLLPHKNISVLLRCFADPRLSAAKLVLFGATDRARFVEAGQPVPDNVIFAGPLRDAQLAALYLNALAVCVPSTTEGFGLPALESMALGRPAIIAPCGALPDVVGDTGLTAAPDDPGAWATAIATLMADEDLCARLSKAAKARAAGFTWEASGLAVLKHLDRWFPG